MNLKISANPSVNYYHTNRISNKKNIGFYGAKQSVLRTMGYTLAASAMLSIFSCANNSSKRPVTQDNENDRFISERITLLNNNDNNNVKKSYYYFPKENNIVNSEAFDWSETIYPDGRIERDSLGYKISITPDGKRTSVKTEKDETGNIIMTTELPDGTKIILTDYLTTNPDEKLIVERTYWSNGNIKENKYYNEYPSDSTNIKSEKIIEQEHQQYNENGVLIQWETSFIDPERNESNNTYDRNGRLIYDDVKNEKYKYRGNSTIPYESVSHYDHCKRITEYDDNGAVQRIYFEASDGTITEKQ